MGGPAGFEGWLKRVFGAIAFGWPKGEAVALRGAWLPAPLVVGLKLKPPNPGLGLSFFVAKIDSPDVLGTGASLFC